MLRNSSRIWWVVWWGLVVGAPGWVCGGWGRVVRGQDLIGEGNVVGEGVDGLLGEIAEVREKVFQTEAGSDVRGKLVEKLLGLRRKLVKDFADDARVSRWRGDLAFDLLFVAGTEGGLDLEVEFGLPSGEMATRYRGYAEEAYRAADEAIAGAGDRVLDIEDSIGFADDQQLQQERRRLVQMEVRRRLPFLYAAAAYAVATAKKWDNERALFATIGGEVSGRGRADYGKGADDSLGKYYQEVINESDDIYLLLDEPWRSRMRVMSALSLIRSGDAEGGSAILDRVKLAVDSDEALRYRVLMGRVMIREAVRFAKRNEEGNGWMEHKDFAEGDPDWVRGQPFYELLRCDYEFRLRLGMGEAVRDLKTEGARWEWLLSAYGPFLEDTKLSMTKGARERAVGERVARVIANDVAVAQLPAIVVLARAEEGLTDEAKRGQAIKWLRGLIERTGSEEWVGARARYLLATGYLLNGERLEAARLFIEVAELFPGSDDAENALEQALGILAGDIDKRGAGLSEAEGALFEKASLIVMKQFSEMRRYDLWMYRRGEFELKKGDGDAAMEAFGKVGKESALYGPALVETARTLYRQGIDVISKGMPNDTDGNKEAKIYFAEALAVGLKAREILTPLMNGENGKMTEEWGGIGGGKLIKNAAAVLAVVMADAQLRCGHADAAILVIDDYQKDLPTGSIRESGQFAELLRLRVEALAQLGRSAEADMEVRTLAREAPVLALPVVNKMVVSIHDDLVREENAGGARSVVEKKAKERLLPLAQLADDLVKGNESISVRYQYAEALRLTGDYGRAKGVFGLLRKDEPNSVEIALGYGESCYQTGEYKTAMRMFGMVSSALIGKRSAMFWIAEARMLQILDRTRHQRERIFPRIQRLRMYDQSLGGGRSQNILDGLEKKYAP